MPLSAWRALTAVAGDASNRVQALEPRVGNLELQTPPTGALNVVSVTADGVNAGSVNTGGLIIIGHWQFGEDSGGNLLVTDVNTGRQQNLTNFS